MQRHQFAPSPQPTPLPWTSDIRIAQTVAAESISLINRSIICGICVHRLYKYKQNGVLDFSELKTQFHFMMLLSVPCCMPYFAFCLYRYETWQCYANWQDTPAGIYRATWTFYSIYRIGLSFQLACLSMTVLQWSNFLSYSERIGRVAQIASYRHTRLVKTLVVLNIFGILGSIIVNVMIMSEPERAENGSGQESVFLYIDWYYLDFVQLGLVFFLMRMGNRMLIRLRDSVMLNEQNKKHVLRKLNMVLFFILFCILVEVCSRIILSMPGFYGETKWEDKPQPFYDMRHFLESQSLLWQFVGYILPYDCVSFCLLYLMRAPMKQQAVFSATVDDEYDDIGTDDDTHMAIHNSEVRNSQYNSSHPSFSSTKSSNHPQSSNHSSYHNQKHLYEDDDERRVGRGGGGGYDRFFDESNEHEVSSVHEEIIGIRRSSATLSPNVSSLSNPLLRDSEKDHHESSSFGNDGQTVACSDVVNEEDSRQDHSMVQSLNTSENHQSDDFSFMNSTQQEPNSDVIIEPLS